MSRTIVVPVAYVHLDDPQLSGRAVRVQMMMMSKGVHARDEDSNASSDRSANWQVAVCVGGRRNAVHRVENAAVDLKIRLLDWIQISGAHVGISADAEEGRACDENSNAYSDCSANWQVAVRLHGRRNAVLRVVNTAVVVEIVPPVLLLLAHVTMVTFR